MRLEIELHENRVDIMANHIFVGSYFEDRKIFLSAHPSLWVDRENIDLSELLYVLGFDYNEYTWNPWLLLNRVLGSMTVRIFCFINWLFKWPY